MFKKYIYFLKISFEKKKNKKTDYFQDILYFLKIL